MRFALDRRRSLGLLRNHRIPHTLRGRGRAAPRVRRIPCAPLTYSPPSPHLFPCEIPCAFVQSLFIPGPRTTYRPQADRLLRRFRERKLENAGVGNDATSRITRPSNLDPLEDQNGGREEEG